MTKEEIIEYWLRSSNDDYEVMNSLFEKKHFVWSLFLGHLVLEKSLKAYYVKKIGVEVPPIHNLTKIADMSGLELTEEQKDFLDEVTTFNIKSRYPDYQYKFARKATESFTERYLIKIKEFRLWLQAMTIR